MTAVASQRRGGGGKFLLLLAIIIGLGASIVFLLPSNNNDIPSNLLDNVNAGTLASLPMTKHASQGRVGTNMDAETIRKMIDDRVCKPIEVYICPPSKQSKLLCYLKPSVDGADELWGGVIVGIDFPHNIITGYVAPYIEYWVGANERDGCWLATRLQ